MVDAQTRQGAINRSMNVAPPETTITRPITHRPEHLAAHDEAVPIGFLQEAPNNSLCPTIGVDVREIEERDTTINRSMQDARRLRIADAFAQSEPAPKGQARDVQLSARYRSVVHAQTIPRRTIWAHWLCTNCARLSDAEPNPQSRRDQQTGRGLEPPTHRLAEDRRQSWHQPTRDEQQH